MNKSFEFGTKVGPFTIVFLMSSLDSCNRSVYFAQDGDMNPAVLYCFAKPEFITAESVKNYRLDVYFLQERS